MKNKEFQRRLVYDTLILLGVLTLILFMCRIWPLILLCILGIFVGMIRLLFLSRKEVVVIQPIPKSSVTMETERDLQQYAFALAIRRITELVANDFPDARWVWKSQYAKEDIRSGRDTSILLNHAGGYREAVVHIQNLIVTGITYGSSHDTEQEPNPTTVTQPVVEQVQNQDTTEPVPGKEPKPETVNYELLAYEWVELHVLDLNSRCNECVAEGASELVIPAAELPETESWDCICRELKRTGIEECETIDEGIKINIKQMNCRKE